MIEAIENREELDLETMFQMVHLSFTAPRKDASAFEAWRARETENARNRRLSPDAAFHEDVGLFFSQNHKRRRPVTPEVVSKVDLDKALDFYKRRFADASAFTFVLVGNLDLDNTRGGRPLRRLAGCSDHNGRRSDRWNSRRKTP